MPSFVVGDPIDRPRHLPLLPRVQGLKSSIFDIRLKGERLVDHVGDVLIDGTLVRKMSGASELKIEIEDVGAKVLNSSLLETGYWLSLDGLGFAFVGWERASLEDPLVLTHEALVVNRLRQLTGPHKAFRDEMTRAEFLRQRVMELKPPRPRFVSPELHKVQPIKTERDGRKAAEEAKQRRGKGIGEVKLTVKGEPASSAQIAAGDRALRVAEAEGADTRVMVALMLGLIVESLIGKVAPNWLEIEPGSVSGFKGNPENLEQAVRGFLLGYNSSTEGAIEYFKKHPGAKAYEITQAVQRSGAGQASGGAANYGPWTEEASEWVSAYGGGAEVTETLRFPFEEKEDENHWELGRKLAAPVNWRWFESAGWVYFIAEPTLFKSHLRMQISDSTPGVLNTSIKGAIGKSHEEVTVEAWASEWSAPPGSVVQMRHHGPADGAYLVDRIESPLAQRASVVTIQLKRPTKAKPEPPNPTRSRSLSGGSGAPGELSPGAEKVLAFCQKEAKRNPPYVWGGFSPAGYDCSGFVSAALNAGGYLSGRLTTVGLAGWGEAGAGDEITVYVKTSGGSTEEHTIIEVGGEFFESGGGENSHGGGVERFDPSASYLTEFDVKRHPKGH